MTIQEFLGKSDRMIAAFQEKEQREWGAEGNVMELAKQVGDLAKRIMVFEKYYFKSRENDPEYKTTKKEIADELADIIWMAIRLSRHYDIDIEAELEDMINRSIDLIENEK
jgi:NTP pyrophosphatase (non-canonical NTP hydrolase)